MLNTRAEVILNWGDGDHQFSLKVPQIDELQRLTARTLIGMMAASGVQLQASAPQAIGAAGIGAIYQRLIGGAPLLSDVREAIRLGLIGGGEDAIRAGHLVAQHVDGKPLATREDMKALAAGVLPATTDRVSNMCAAIACVGAAFVGLPELPKPKKARAARKKKTGS